MIVIKKILSIATVLLLMCLVLFGCSQKTNNESDLLDESEVFADKSKTYSCVMNDEDSRFNVLISGEDFINEIEVSYKYKKSSFEYNDISLFEEDTRAYFKDVDGMIVQRNDSDIFYSILIKIKDVQQSIDKYNDEIGYLFGLDSMMEYRHIEQFVDYLNNNYSMMCEVK